MKERKRKREKKERKREKERKGEREVFIERNERGQMNDPLASNKTNNGSKLSGLWVQ